MSVVRESRPESTEKKGTVAIFRGLDCQLTRPRQGSVPYDERPAGNSDLPGREAARGEMERSETRNVSAPAAGCMMQKRGERA